MKTQAIALFAGLGLAGTSAQAADLIAPPITDPVDYVRVCDAFGVGFFYIPGTETCLRIAGRVRADYNVFIDFEDNGFEVLDTFGFDDRGDDAYRFRARSYLYMDSRTATEFGLLRTFSEVQFTQDTNAPIDTTLNRAFIQFGGLTFGRTQSFYDFLDATFGTAQLLNANYSDTTTNVLAYTAAFGNGFSASLSIEDSSERSVAIADPADFIPAATFAATNDGYGGTRFPDVVGNIRVDQGWGSAQLMGAGHYVHPGAVNTGSDYGFAVGGGVTVNVPFGESTQIGIQGAYTVGALSYVAETPIGPGVADAVYTSATTMSLVNAFSVSGGASFAFTPTISVGLQGGYLNVDHADVAGVSYDFVNWDAEAFIGYAPVPGFTLGVGAQFKYVDTDDFSDGAALSTFFRAQRTF